MEENTAQGLLSVQTALKAMKVRGKMVDALVEELAFTHTTR